MSQETVSSVAAGEAQNEAHDEDLFRLRNKV